MNDYLWGFLMGYILGAVTMWVNECRGKVSKK